ncbi:MAG: hypothetical protein A3C02_04160 [Candidatus Andersenbacteria bacterium RIFCSPHIGHO2_02_FULL_45_11]|uniref:Fido domain-containing protein n=1 Tax=Candidatus Andersenbacteria bacterium RIFCSPHIGHO2_12_FULL_45_11 TaxID=1797281 RepID=A0A1G1WZZ3_9BACT|nr:MAG: hypothetical protein A2805_00595 [Candidatus Andersenbacteria bacterium RIFCSPHIGHO2_01_FULL_46_36]OGY33111.1 MAG: hypothetical protein A3D99_01480 [Candidatus Andersenbacteria bacterium RIFCSPHIGHO2_12_FULL_45_11]OGY34473.1 MAG: hypothetical protein A3C02_04160 [Candidatus Andersenbacteria bacterium RIFCSPHIGHO2_02_FULL_45_11]
MDNKRFEQRLENIPNHVWATISQIDELKGQWIAGARLSPQVLGRLKRSVLITSTGASTRIEGAKLSDEDIERLMSNLSVQKFVDRDAQEVRGYYELLEKVFNSWERLHITESAIKHWHNELLKHVSKDERHRGDYKKVENSVHMIDAEGNPIALIFETVPAYLTPKAMQELVEWTQNALDKRTYHPLLIIANFLVEFLRIHPFQDGNGRLSRVLTNLLLLHAGYLYMPYTSHEKFVEDNKSDYYLALRKSQKTFGTDTESIEPWLEFFLSIFLSQSEMAVELLSRENIEKILSPKQLAVWQHIEEVEEVTPGDIARLLGIARPTVNQALDRLLKLKRIERIGQGRSTRYRKLK